MIGSHNWLPRQVNCGVMLVLILISPVSALAHSESAGSPGSSAAQVGSSGKPIDDILNMDIELLAKVNVRVPVMDIPTCNCRWPDSVGTEAAIRVGASVSHRMVRKKGIYRWTLLGRGRLGQPR